VAKAADVSIATVSFVLNTRPGQAISEKVRQRVLREAKRLNYHPSATAAGLARKKTHNIAIVLYRNERLISNQFYSFVIQGAIHEAIRREYNLLFSYLPGPYRGYEDLPKIIREDNAAGAIFISEVDPHLIEDIRARGIPVLAIDHFPRVPKLPALDIDNQRGGRLAAEHLAELGHTRIGVLQAATDRPSVSGRVEGFRAALADHKIRFSERSNVLECRALAFEAGYQRVLGVLKRGTPLTALFCVNDELAAGVLRAAHECGLDVPKHLSVVGFDGISMSSYTDPPLTTVSVGKENLGARAIENLIALVEERPLPPAPETVPVELIVRGSTAPPTR
jgi:DNA-binding LacI/PurR family transcriptional regulator